MKKRMLLITMLIVAVLASGCAKVVSQWDYTAPVTIVKTHHRDSYTTFMWTGHSYMPIHHSEENVVTVESGDKVQYRLYGKSIYKLCHGREGEYMTGHFTRTVYDNGKAKTALCELSEPTETNS